MTRAYTGGGEFQAKSQFLKIPKKLSPETQALELDSGTSLRPRQCFRFPVRGTIINEGCTPAKAPALAERWHIARFCQVSADSAPKKTRNSSRNWNFCHTRATSVRPRQCFPFRMRVTMIHRGCAQANAHALAERWHIAGFVKFLTNLASFMKKTRNSSKFKFTQVPSYPLAYAFSVSCESQ